MVIKKREYNIITGRRISDDTVSILHVAGTDHNTGRGVSEGFVSRVTLLPTPHTVAMGRQINFV